MISIRAVSGSERISADTEVEGVEEKVRIDLALEHFDLRGQQQRVLFLQPVLDAGAVPDLDRGATASTAASTTSASWAGRGRTRKNSRCAPNRVPSACRSNSSPTGASSRMTCQFGSRRESSARGACAGEKDERRKLPDDFLRAGFAQAPAREPAADRKRQRDEFAGNRRAAPSARRSHRHRAGDQPARKAPSSVRSAAE